MIQQPGRDSGRQGGRETVRQGGLVAVTSCASARIWNSWLLREFDISTILDCRFLGDTLLIGLNTSINHITHDISTKRFSWLNENQIVPMNGFADHGLDEAAFGEKKGFTEGLRTFDAFRKLYTNPSHGFPTIVHSQCLFPPMFLPCVFAGLFVSNPTSADERQQKPNPPTPAEAPLVATRPYSCSFSHSCFP